MTDVSTLQKQGLHKLVLSQPKSSLLWGNAPKSFFDGFRSTILVGNGKVSDAGKKRTMEAVKAKGVLIVRCNKYYKHGDSPNVVPHVLAVCSEVSKHVFKHCLAKGILVFLCDRSKRCWNRSEMESYVATGGKCIRFRDDAWTDISRAADFTRGFIAMLFLEWFLTRVCGISVVGFGGAGHAQSKAILYHQIAAEHRLYPGMVEEGVLNVLDPTAFPCSGAREEVNADLPCPACKKRNVQKKLGGGRVLCRCGRTYNPTAVPKKMPQCPHFKQVLKRGRKHAVDANGKKYNR